MKFIEKLFLKDLRITVKILIYFFLGLAIIVFLIHGVISLGFRYPLDYGEGPLLNQALRLTQGEPLYPADISTPPYLISNYPPVYVLFNAFLIWIFGPNLIIGRMISFLSTLGTAIFIALIIQLLSNNRKILPPLIGAASFLIIPYVLQWSPLFRIDMLALFFTMTGLYFVVKNPHHNQSTILAACMFILATYTRQSFALAAPLAAIIWTATKNKQKAIKLFLIYALGGLLIFGLLQWLTDGGFFFHIVSANINPFNWDTVWHYAQQIVNRMPLLIIILVLYLTLGWHYTQTYTLMTPYLIIAMITAVTIGKVGSNVNYLVEVSAGLALLIGITFERLSETYNIEPGKKPDVDFPKSEIPPPEQITPDVRRKVWINLAVFFTLAISFVFQISGLTKNSLLGPITNLRDRVKRGTDYILLEANIKKAAEDGPVLADEFMAMLPDNRINLYAQPFEITQLANGDLWDQNPFLKSISNQKFPMILIHHFQNYPVYLERWTPKMRQAIYDNYVAIDIRADSLMFVPKDFENVTYPEDHFCPGALWQLPTRGDMGLFWFNGQLLMMGDGYTGEIPVYAIADGLLYQFPGWETSVAIQHDDPLNPGQKIWSFYGDLAPAFDKTYLYIEDIFIGAVGIPVEAGDLLGYQGQWLGPNQQTWVHLRFTLLPATEDGSFPESILPIDNFHASLPSYREQARLGLDAPVPLSTYTGLPESDFFGELTFLPFKCLAGE